MSSVKNTIPQSCFEGIVFLGGARIPLCPGCNIVEGEISLVNVIEDWDILEEYAGEKLGFCQLLAND